MVFPRGGSYYCGCCCVFCYRCSRKRCFLFFLKKKKKGRSIRSSMTEFLLVEIGEELINIYLKFSCCDLRCQHVEQFDTLWLHIFYTQCIFGSQIQTFLLKMRHLFFTQLSCVQNEIMDMICGKLLLDMYRYLHAISIILTLPSVALVISG